MDKLGHFLLFTFALFWNDLWDKLWIVIAALVQIFHICREQLWNFISDNKECKLISSLCRD